MKKIIPVILAISMLILSSCKYNSSSVMTEYKQISVKPEPEPVTESVAETEAEKTNETDEKDKDDIDFESEIPSEHSINAKIIYQNPELPTGCEITSLDMLLYYWGYSIDKVVLSNKYLKKNYDYSCTFNDAFIGDPESEYGFGCYASVITDSAQSYLTTLSSRLDAYNISGLSLDDIFHYIALDRPVIVWASINLSDVRHYLAWTTDSGKEAWWYENEHCMLLTGYDYKKNTVTVCDPLEGKYTYDMDRFKEVFDTLEQQAVTIF